MMRAAQLAGVKVLQLINDNAAGIAGRAVHVKFALESGEKLTKKRGLFVLFVLFDDSCTELWDFPTEGI